MDVLEYQQRLLEHATARGYGPPREEITTYTFVWDGAERSHTTRHWIFTTSTGQDVKVSLGDNVSSLRSYLIHAKGQLTSGQNTTGRPLRSPPKHGYPPSKTSDEDWLFAEAPGDPIEMDSDISGKWLVFVPFNKVDEAWKRVAGAVRQGQLAPFAKVSTFKSNYDGTRPYVMCIYAPDHRDRSTVMLIRERLRSMGFERKLYFKLDQMTLRGERGSLFSA